MSTEAWIVPTVAMLDDYLAADAMTAFKAEALGPGQTNPFDRVMPNAVAKVRGYILACSRNSVSETANSVPASLLEITILLTIQAMQGRVMANFTKSQEKLLSDGMDMLKSIAKCEMPVSAPPDPAPSTIQGGVVAETISYSERRVTRDKLNGL